MENVFFSLNAVLPLFLLMCVGFLARRLRLLDDHLAQGLSSLNYYVFIPVLLCRNILSAGSEESFPPRIFLFVVVGITVHFALCFLLTPLFVKDRVRCGTLIQALGRGNYAIFGLPLVTSLYADADVSLISLLVVVVIPLYSLYSILAFSVFCQGKLSAVSLLKKLFLNPFVIASALGLLLYFLQPPLPEAVTRAADSLAGVASPLALFSLGASLDFSRVGKNLKTVLLVSFLRLIVTPCAALAAALPMGFRGVELAAVVAVFAAPIAVNSFTVAQRLGGDAELAAETVIVTSAGSVLTVFLIVFVLRHFFHAL